MELDAFQSFNLGILVLFVGKYLNSKVQFFREFNIPEPVTGGLLFSIGFTIVYFGLGVAVSFDLEVRDALLVYFFTSIGLNSDFRTLLAGGRALIILLTATIFYMVLQNIIGVGVAQATGQPAVVGLLGGTVSLIGGHGTSIAWAPTFAEEYGITNAIEIGIACATFGLVLASLMGGPIAHYLIGRYRLEPEVVEQPDFGAMYDEAEEVQIDYLSVLYTWLVLNIAIGIGLSLNEAIAEAGFRLPTFVTCLFAGILLTNTVPLLFKKLKWPSRSRPLALISDLALGVFLAMSLMSLQLWALIDLALPILAILFAQFVVAAALAVFVIFRIMGKDYEAAVVCSGFGGVSLGSTPTAIANMTAVTERFGAAHKAFIVVPLVSAFFIDIANAFIIKFFLGLVS
jgi:ESS family glutamate:Na+ symporter